MWDSAQAVHCDSPDCISAIIFKYRVLAERGKGPLADRDFPE